jgi:hypothetical protein
MPTPAYFDALKQAFADKAYLMTDHASAQAIKRDIDDDEVEQAVLNGGVIEDYPNDKYGPSCLVMGKTTAGRVLHVQASHPPKVKVITVYEPSPLKWEADWKTRKKP